MVIINHLRTYIREHHPEDKSSEAAQMIVGTFPTVSARSVLNLHVFGITTGSGLSVYEDDIPSTVAASGMTP